MMKFKTWMKVIPKIVAAKLQGKEVTFGRSPIDGEIIYVMI